MTASNTRNAKQLADNITVADNLFKRMKGLLGKSEMQAGEALWIKPCTSIHTFLMKFPIDVVFLNTRNQVIAAIGDLRPNRITRLYLKAVSALELPAGTIKKAHTRIGDEIKII